MADDIFNFTQSLNSFHWVMKSCDESEVSALADTYNLPFITALIMQTRGINTANAKEFISGSLRDFLPEPFILKDMQKAAERTATAIKNKEKIALFSDYDVDGATSAAVICLFLQRLGLNIPVVIPERNQGYGPNLDAMEQFVADKVQLLITTDCGTSADEQLNLMTKSGADVIVLDHHEPDAAHIPEVFALVNPKQAGEDKNHPCRIMAAVGIAFMFIVALNRKLRQDNFYTENGLYEPDLTDFLDIVAFGTVCDVVSLSGINRLLVKAGLRTLIKERNIGLKVLADACDIASPLSVYHLGFVLGPRINAGGRLGKASLGQRLLCSHDEIECENIAFELCNLNDERKDVEAYVLAQAIKQIEIKATPDTKLVFAYGENWHNGVIGIVAGRLKDRYHLPSVVLSVEGDTAHASCRSLGGIDIGAAIVEGVANGILLKGGGHTMAAGFSVEKAKLKQAEDFLNTEIAKQMANMAEGGTGAALEIDALLDVGALNHNFFESLSLLEPFGEGNPEPLFALKDVNVFFLDIKGAGHICCRIKSRSGASVKGIAFKAADTALGQSIMKSCGEPFHLAGYLRINEWQGRKTPQFVIVDGVRV